MVEGEILRNHMVEVVLESPHPSCDTHTHAQPMNKTNVIKSKQTEMVYDIPEISTWVEI